MISKGDMMGCYESGLISPEQFKAVVGALELGQRDPSYLSAISGTGPIRHFEESFAQAVGAKFAIALSSCTAALHVALMALGIGPGDEVIVPPYTWGQSVASVLFSGATVVFADIKPKTQAIDPNSIVSRITKKTKAIIPVHIFGNPADMDAISDIAKRNRIKVVSDAAQAFGARLHGKEMGGFGDAAGYSLGRGKAVCGGEGGVMVTNDEDLYERAVAISQHPLRAEGEIVDGVGIPYRDELGWNFRIHPVAAVFALADLKTAQVRRDHRRNILKIITEELASCTQIIPVGILPEGVSAAYGVPLTYISEKSSSLTREALINLARKMNIPLRAGPVRQPIHLRQTFQKQISRWHRVVPHPSQKKGCCPVAEKRCAHEELLLFSGVEMDRLSEDSARETARQLNKAAGSCCWLRGA